MLPDNDRATILNLIKVVDKAIMMERNARSFYRAASRRLESAEGKKMFDWLADFEAAHESRLMSTRKDLFADPAMEGYQHFPVEDDSTASEVHTTDFAPTISEQQILLIAVENEKAAQTYYQTSGADASNEAVKAIFDRMAHEEERHIVILSDQLKHLQVERFWMDWAAFDDSQKRPGD